MPVNLRIPYTVDLFGPEPRASNALRFDLSVKSYGFPGSALTASTQAFTDQANVKIVYALWDVAWNPAGKAGNGVELVKFKEGPSELTQIAQFTGETGSSAVHKQANVTSALEGWWEEAAKSGSGRFVGHRMKSDAGAFTEANQAILFMSRLILVLQTVE